MLTAGATNSGPMQDLRVVVNNVDNSTPLVFTAGGNLYRSTTLE